jgi:Fic family protein
MSITQSTKEYIEKLKKEYDSLKKGKESLLVLIEEAEISESVYNSNAIENSTLSLKETEKILLDEEVPRDVSVREVFEAKNLARVIEFVRNTVASKEMDTALLLELHKMLLTGISDSIAGRFREKGEYVRVSDHIAPSPEHVESMINALFLEYSSDFQSYFVEKIAKYHLEFEHIHPFNDGNGRIGRVVLNYQLQRLGFPGIIIRDKEKKAYYETFGEYKEKKVSQRMEKIIVLGLLESLHKRITYLQDEKVIKLAEYIKKHTLSAPAVTNEAKRQVIPAFREKGVWKISENYRYNEDR